MSRWLERLFLIASFLLAFYLCLWPAFSHAEGLYSDGFDHRACAVTLMPQRHNLAVTIGPPAGGSDLKLRMEIAGLPVRKGEALQGALVGQGGTAPYVYSIAAGSLPTGISLNGSTGILSGTPTVVGRYVFLAEVQDAALGVFKCTLAIEVIPAFEVIAMDPPPAENGTVYQGYLYKTSGATGPVTWLDNGPGFPGSLLNINFFTGELSGTVTSVVSNPGTITVTDTGSGDSIVIPYHLYVYDTLSVGFTYLASNPVSGSSMLPPIYIGTPWSTGTFIPDGNPPLGIPPFTRSVQSSPTIPGLTIDQNTGEISVTVTDPAFALGYVAPYAIGVTVVDALGVTAVNTANVAILLSQQVIETQNAGVSTNKFGTPVYNFSADFTVNDDGSTVDIGLAGGGSSLTGDGVTIDIDSAGIISAISAPKLTTARTIAMTGDVAWSVSFDGSGNVTAAGTLATVNSNVGTFGDATHVAQVTVNGKGLVTAASNVAITGTSPVGSALTSANIWVGNASNVAAAVAVSGDSTITNAGVMTNSVASALRTARSITMTGDVAWTVSFDGSGNVTAAGTIATAAVTDAKLANMGALSVKGRSANSSGVPADIAASAASGAVLRESGSTIGFGTVATAGIADNAVTLAKLATQADSTILSNASGSTAVPSANSMTTFFNHAVSSTAGSVAATNGTTWGVTGPNDNTKYLDGTGVFSVPSATGGAGWATALDMDFSAQSNQTLSTDTTYSIGGYTWTKGGSANDSTAMAVTNGTGLVIIPKTTGTYNGTTRTAPNLYIDVASIIPSYYIDMPLRISVYMSADNFTANNDTAGAFLDNLAGTATNVMQEYIARGYGAGGRILNLAFATQAGSVTSSTITPTALDSTNRVLVMSLPNGRWTTLAAGYYSAIGGSNAWPANSTLIPFTKLVTSTGNTTGSDLVTGLPMKIGVFAQRNGSATALSVTIMKLKIEYKVT